MGQCVSSGKSPSALQCCQAYERQEAEANSRTSAVSAQADGTGTGGAPVGQVLGRSIWHHVAREEVKALGEIVKDWAQGLLDGHAARHMLQARVLRGFSDTAVRFEQSLNFTLPVQTGSRRVRTHVTSVSMTGITMTGSPHNASPVARTLPAVQPVSVPGAYSPGVAEAGNRRGSPLVMSSPIASSGLGSMAGSLGNLVAGLALALGGAVPTGQAHEVFQNIDSVFLCGAYGDAHRLALREMGIDGPQPLPDEVRASFRRQAKDILDTVTGQPITPKPFLDLVRLCLFVEVLRHLSPWARGGPIVDPYSVPGFSPFAGGPGVNVVFVANRPRHGDGLSVVTMPDGAVTPNGTARLDTTVLRERVALLLELLLGGNVDRFEQRGLSRDEISRLCPAGQRAASDGCCPICLEPAMEGEPVLILPCRHELHTECCEAWLETSGTCPTCRHKVQSLE